MSRTTILVLLVAAASACARGQGLEAEKERVAALLGVGADDLQRFSTHRLLLPRSSRAITLAKGLDRGSGHALWKAIDEETGRNLDLEQLLRAERSLAPPPAEKLHPLLADALARADEGRTLPVIAWLDFDGDRLDAFRRERLRHVTQHTPSAVVDELEREITAFVAASNEEVVGPFLRELQARSLRVRGASALAPAVFTSATPSEVAWLAGHPRVRGLFLEDSRRRDANQDANGTHRTNSVHSAGVHGSGVRVAVLEDNGLQPASPYLSTTAWYSGTFNPDDHVHASAGCIASQKSDRLGAAPDVILYSANATSYLDSDVVAAADWIGLQNVDVTNMSFGGNYSGALQFLDHYFDYQSRYLVDSYVVSAGNDGATVAPYVESPGTAWNVITVGSFNEQGNPLWFDDAMASTSAFADPASGCQKPNLAANGVSVDTLGDGNPAASMTTGSQPAPWLYDNASGTSFAAPHVTGNLADAMSVNSVLKSSPPAAMALMMATAWHNIEGANDLSDLDGAGGLDGWAAYQCALAGRVDSGSFTSSSFDASGYFWYPIDLTDGKKTRVCLTWSADAVYASGLAVSTLGSDFDMDIVTGSGPYAVWASSSSSSNNYEIVEFTPPADGTYYVRIQRVTLGPFSEPWGLAWSTECDTGLLELGELISVPFASQNPVTMMGATVGSDFDLGILSAPLVNTTYIVAPSLDASSGFAIPGVGYVPAAFDPLTQLWLDTLGMAGALWSGTVGMLDSGGSSPPVTVSLPVVPGVEGLDIHHVAIHPGGPGIEVPQPLTTTLLPAASPLPLGDDQSMVVTLPMRIPFQGTSYTQIAVSSNGCVTFGGQDAGPGPSVPAFLSGLPRLAFLWGDLDPSAPGAGVQTRFVAGPSPRFVLEFIEVPEKLPNGALVGSNTVRVSLWYDGRIRVEYGPCSALAALVGVSPGNGISSAMPVDLSHGGHHRPGPGQAIFETFAPGPASGFDLAGPQVGPQHFTWSTVGFVPVSPVAGGYELRVFTRP